MGDQKPSFEEVRERIRADGPPHLARGYDVVALAEWMRIHDAKKLRWRREAVPGASSSTAWVVELDAAGETWVETWIVCAAETEGDGFIQSCRLWEAICTAIENVEAFERGELDDPGDPLVHGKPGKC
jgi:hypothetical protein